MFRRTLLAAAVLIGFGCGSTAPEPDRAGPNFLLVLADDQGWGDLSIHGNRNLSTPNIDSLGRDGALFDRFYVGPVCSPTRAELLTGRYYPRGGVRGTSAGLERLDLDEWTVAETLSAAGYATGVFGKWHNGSQAGYHPLRRGFDVFYGFTSGHWADYFDPMLEDNGRWVRGKGFIIDDLTDRALAFIEENDDQPFFCYLPLNTPHSPMQVPDRFWAKFDGAELDMHNRDPEREDVQHIRAALAMVENIDWNVGRLIAKLDELQIADDTLVVYMSDNGPNGYRWNADMKGRKGAIDEGGVRVPGLFRWRSQIMPGQVIKQIAGAVDILPTFADLADAEIVGDKPLDGRSLKPLLLDEDVEWPDREIVSYRFRDGGQVSVRNQRFRLDSAGALFDIDADPGQRTDVAAEHPEETARLQAVADRMLAELNAELGDHDERPYLIAESGMTWLPARDAEATPPIERSNRFPNSSYFRNWTSTDAEITWDVEALAAGSYEATVYYALPESGVGTKLELSLGEAKIEKAVEEVHDPPLIGAENDRVERQESYIKDFRPLSLGEIEIAAGPGTLRLRSPEIVGPEGIEMYWLVLERQR